MSLQKFDANEIFHAEIAEYDVPVTPKTRDKYNMFTNSFVRQENYSLSKLKNAEQAFLTLQEIFQNDYSNAFVIKQDKPLSRIANITSRINFEQKIVHGYREVNLSLFTLSLQNGIVYNFPIAQLEKTFDIKIDPKVIMLREGGNKGCSLKQAIKFMSSTKQLLSEIFKQNGHIMTDEYFATILCLSRLQRANVINLDINGWIEYIVAGKNLQTIMFGFNRAMFGSGKISYIPVDEVDEYESLPREWLASIFNTIQNRQVVLF